MFLLLLSFFFFLSIALIISLLFLIINGYADKSWFGLLYLPPFYYFIFIFLIFFLYLANLIPNKIKQFKKLNQLMYCNIL